MNNNLKELLDFAIDEEEKAYTLYSNLANNTTDKSAKIMLEDLAKTEQGHANRLRSFEKKDKDSLNTHKSTDIKVTDYMDDVELSDDADFQTILLYAIQAEKHANELYTALSAIISDPDKKKFLEALAEEEIGHKYELEKYYQDHFMKEN